MSEPCHCPNCLFIPGSVTDQTGDLLEKKLQEVAKKFKKDKKLQGELKKLFKQPKPARKKAKKRKK